MFRILIVDDEHIERKGMKLLIAKYGLELSVLEAENGEEALETLDKHEVDIMLTDIKMPFMDGLELCRRARQRFPELKIIIFSAFGEFEYARQAIQYHIFSYLLKPIDVQDFLREFTSVLELCRKERDEKAYSRMLLDGYQKGLEHEKETMLLHLLNGRDSASPEQLAQAGVELRDKRLQMILIDLPSPVFAGNDQEVMESVSPLIPAPFETIHLNGNQCLLLVMYDPEQPGCEEPSELGNRLKDYMTVMYGQQVTLVMGKPVLSLSELAGEFRSMENTVEEKFFFQESVVLFTDERQANRDLSDTLPKLTETIGWHLEVKDRFGFRRGVELFFKTVEGSGQHSAIYIKYVSAELAKKVLQTLGKEDALEFRRFVENIFGSRTLAELKEHVYGVMALLDTADGHSSPDTKKVIKDIIKLIDEHYMTDLSLAWLADKVYLTQTYLSHLFSKEMGLTLIKYITQVRMQKAAELLRGTNMTIADISAKVGFMNDSYFCKIFKHYHGMPPAKFREARS
ncbi:response regulator [Paenibacillus chartarius]|uniref:Response regulator n=1 Tax=Paenibacillus chartarius TaxID=747481 RepID=A0ABV6DJ50_9BACL